MYPLLIPLLTLVFGAVGAGPGQITVAGPHRYPPPTEAFGFAGRSGDEIPCECVVVSARVPPPVGQGADVDIDVPGDPKPPGMLAIAAFLVLMVLLVAVVVVVIEWAFRRMTRRHRGES